MNKLFWQTAKVASAPLAVSLFAANDASSKSISVDEEAVNNILQQIRHTKHYLIINRLDR